AHLTAHIDRHGRIRVLIEPRLGKGHVGTPQRRMGLSDQPKSFGKQDGPAGPRTALLSCSCECGKIHASFKGNGRDLLAEIHQVGHESAKGGKGMRSANFLGHGTSLPELESKTYLQPSL